VRPLALCVVRRDDGSLLVAAGHDEVKQQRFYRPLGGEIEFGETAADAARRELLEEMGADVTDLRLLATFENIFTYRGTKGHELVWTFEGRFVDPSLYDGEVVVCDEGGARFEAHWVPLDVFLRHEALLYPDGLLEALTA
ncbi:MAG TPA: NUDIX hydrolase, partial [Dehalococcoidia bacterium]|nr:NUDIX hydrolase [Dehalococcoidia bacterium]